MRGDDLNDLLEEIRPNEEEFMQRRIKNGNFAKAIIYLCVLTKDSDCVSVGELARFMRYSIQRARYVLEELVKVGLLRRSKVGSSIVEYYFNDDGKGDIKVLSYFNEAKRSLGIKFKVKAVKLDNRKI